MRRTGDAGEMRLILYHTISHKSPVVLLKVFGSAENGRGERWTVICRVKKDYAMGKGVKAISGQPAHRDYTRPERPDVFDYL
jgi:hypothetical protein